MKIISYNINSCSKEKVGKLLEKQADIYVVSEISCKEELALPGEFEMEWNGLKWKDANGRNQSKGLGIVYKKGQATVPEWYGSNLKYAIPLLCNDILILGIWPTKDKERPDQSYTQIAKDILECYAPHFREKTLIIGDFNLFCKKDKNTDADILQINKFLVSENFSSLYHKKTGEDFGAESEPTYYHQFKEAQPFFLDYTYSNFEVKDYELLDFGRKFSDHVGQVVEI